MRMRPTWRNPPRVVAHRGAPHRAVENTLPSFVHAVVEGAQAIELDVRLTRDGEVVVHHDARVGRLVPGDEAVEELDAADLLARPLPGGARVPTLREVLAHVPSHVLLDVELKADARNALELPARVHDIVEEHGAQERVLATSFDGETASLYAQHAGRPAGHILPFEPDEADLGDWPLLTTTVLAAGAASAEAVRLLRDAGRTVMVYTVNEPAEARRLLALGVHALVTDRPGRLLRALRPDASAP